MPREQFTSQDNSERSELGAESPEAVEARKQKWRRLRSFALAASLVLNGGFLAERAMQGAKLDKLEGDLEAGGGVHFVVEGAEKGAFQVTRVADGGYELQGTLTKDGREVKVRYRLPASEDMKQNIADLTKRDPLEVVNKMIELATTGTLTTRDPDTGVTHENTFDQAPDQRGITNRQVTYNSQGSVTDTSEINVVSEPMPDGWVPGNANQNEPPNPMPGTIPNS